MASTLKEMQERETFAAGKSAKRAESSGSASTAAAKAALTRKFNQVMQHMVSGSIANAKQIECRER